MTGGGMVVSEGLADIYVGSSGNLDEKDENSRESWTLVIIGCGVDHG